MPKFRNHHSGVKILSLIKLMIYHFRGIFMVFPAVISTSAGIVGKSDISTGPIWWFSPGRYPNCFAQKSYWDKESFSFGVNFKSISHSLDLWCGDFWPFSANLSDVFFTFFFLKWETWQSVLLGCLSIVFIGYYVISPSLLTSFSMVTLLLVWVDFGLNWIKKKGTTTESLSRDERLRVIYSDYVYVITFIDSLKVKFQIHTLIYPGHPLYFSGRLPVKKNSTP